MPPSEWAGRSSREQARYERLHYPGTGVLRNRLGLRDREQLDFAERYFSGKRARQEFPSSALSFDIEGIRAIHRHLFQDIYDWAGEFRTYTTGRGPAPFATPENIRGWLERQFQALRVESLLIGMTADEFAVRAAHYVIETNAAHPFIEGNGRIQRVWLRLLASHSGYRVRLRSEHRDRWYEASRLGFERADPKPMAELIRECMTKAPGS